MFAALFVIHEIKIKTNVSITYVILINFIGVIVLRKGSLSKLLTYIQYTAVRQLDIKQYPLCLSRNYVNKAFVN